MLRVFSLSAVFLLSVGLLGTECALDAQSLGNASTIEGTVVDPSGAAVTKATVEIQNPVSQFARTAQTDSQGKFQFENVPFNNYHVRATAAGFQSADQDVSVRSGVPVETKFSLNIGIGYH